ncbi:MAG: NTP transferase domain-containing protein [Clostridia bacterium]|nr:NTP transferase domain-containing protein [Clostridia bacterium]
MKKITKAVITAGGYATRFLPITKAVPKEMLPLGDKPVIHYILEELQDAGITEVLFLIGRGRESLMNYLDKNYEVDDYLARRVQQTRDAVPVSKTTNFFKEMNLFFRRVPLPQGVADCVRYASSFVGDEPFVLAYCDDVFFAGNPTVEMLSAYEKTGKSAIIAAPVPWEDAHRYGIITSAGQIIEKPSQPTSNLVAVGRYLLPANFCQSLGDDIVEALNKIPEKNIITTHAKRFDTGNKNGFYEAFKYVMTELG